MDARQKARVVLALRAALEGIPVPHGEHKLLFSEDYKIFGYVHKGLDGETDYVSTLSEVTLAQFVGIMSKMTEEEFINLVFTVSMTKHLED